MKNNRKQGFDHIRLVNKKWLASRPPAQPTDEEIKTFGEDVLESMEQKLKELMHRSNELKQEKEFNSRLIEKYVKEKYLDNFEEWMWTYWSNLFYAENDNINLWIKYWVKIYERVKHKTIHVEIRREGEITDEMVEKAKEYPIQDLYEGELRDLGNKLIGLCPFHGESTPSFTIFTSDNHFYCFGCNVWGDPIDFYMKTKNVTMPQAIRELQT